MQKDYLPDEYQYPGEEIGDTFESESPRAGVRTKLEEKAGKDLDPDHDPALSRFYLRDPMKITKKFVGAGVAAGAAAAIMTMDVANAAVDTTQNAANAAKDTTINAANKGFNAASAVTDMATDQAKKGLDQVGMLEATLKATDAVTDVAGQVTQAAGELAGGLGLRQQTDREDQLHFAEFVHMMQSGKIDGLFPGSDWRAGAKQICAYRKAFDTADVDGDDTLEQGEFEMVMDTLHIGHDLTPAEVRYCWDTLKSSRPKTSVANHLTFLEFIAGVQAVRKDDVLKGRLDFTKPCPWDMLSLLIDTPVSKLEEERLYNELTKIEQLGLGMVKKFQRSMNRGHIKQVLTEVVQGRLHFLSEDKIMRMNTVWFHCVFQVSFI